MSYMELHEKQLYNFTLHKKQNWLILYLKRLNPKVPIFQNCSKVPAKYRKHLQANLTMFSSIVSEPSWRNSTAWPQGNQQGQTDDGFVVVNGNPSAIFRGPVTHHEDAHGEEKVTSSEEEMVP